MRKIVLLMTVFSVLIIVSCDNGTTGSTNVSPDVSPFEGNWAGVITISSGSGGVDLIFAGDIWGYPNSPTDLNRGTFTYDNTYLYLRASGGFSHIVETHKYEFRDNGNELHLTYVRELSNVILDTTYQVYTRVK